MGAWGTGPYDNDSAADLLGDLADKLTPRLLTWLKSGDLYDVRTAAWVMGQLGVSPYTAGSWYDERDDLDGLSLFGFAIETLRQASLAGFNNGEHEWGEAIMIQADYLESVERGDLAEPGLLSKIAGLTQ